MSFVNLPVEGDPAARLPEILDQIQAALAEDRDTRIRRVGKRIEFWTDSLSKRWLFRGRFTVSAGEIEAEASSDSVMIDYRLKFFELFVVLAAMVPVYAVAMIHRAGVASLRFYLPWLVFAVVVCFAAGLIRATLRFSRFLRQFPRDVRDPQ